MTYQKAKACVINTSLDGWIAEGDKPKVPLWIQIDVTVELEEEPEWRIVFLMHEGSLQTNVSDMVISLGLRAAVLQEELRHVM